MQALRPSRLCGLVGFRFACGRRAVLYRGIAFRQASEFPWASDVPDGQPIANRRYDTSPNLFPRALRALTQNRVELADEQPSLIGQGQRMLCFGELSLERHNPN